MAKLPELRVNEIGEYIRHRCCPRRFKLGLDDRRAARRLPFHERLFGSLDPVLQHEGRRREQLWEKMLRDGGYQQIGAGDGTLEWSKFAEGLRAVPMGERVFARELQVSGQIGSWRIRGRVDFALVLWDQEKPRLRLVECKASRRDRTYQRIQVAIYNALVRGALVGAVVTVGKLPLTSESVEAVVARIDEATNTPQSILKLPPLDLSMEDADIVELLGEKGPLVQHAVSELDDLPYQLDPKCDSCIFNTDCLPESGLHRRLQLLGLSPPTVRALKQAGVDDIDALAELDPAGVEAARLQADSAFAESTRRLVVRARTRRRSLPGGDGGYDVEPLPHTGYGALPEHTVDGRRLIRVHLAIDYDYAENRIGAISAHVTTSANLLHTPFTQEDGKWSPHPQVREVPAGLNPRDISPEQWEDVRGVDVIKFKSSPWSGRYDVDTGAERELIEGFLHELVDAMDEVTE